MSYRLSNQDYIISTACTVATILWSFAVIHRPNFRIYFSPKEIILNTIGYVSEFYNATCLKCRWNLYLMFSLNYFATHYGTRVECHWVCTVLAKRLQYRNSKMLIRDNFCTIFRIKWVLFPLYNKTPTARVSENHGPIVLPHLSSSRHK